MNGASTKLRGFRGERLSRASVTFRERRELRWADPQQVGSGADGIGGMLHLRLGPSLIRYVARLGEEGGGRWISIGNRS